MSQYGILTLLIFFKMFSLVRNSNTRCRVGLNCFVSSSFFVLFLEVSYESIKTPQVSVILYSTCKKNLLANFGLNET